MESPVKHWDLLDSKSIHEHDMVSKGPVDVQVDLFDLSGVESGLFPHFLSGDKDQVGKRHSWLIWAHKAKTLVKL